MFANQNSLPPTSITRADLHRVHGRPLQPFNSGLIILVDFLFFLFLFFFEYQAIRETVRIDRFVSSFVLSLLLISLPGGIDKRTNVSNFLLLRRICRNRSEKFTIVVISV